jgi:hypothetical protein
VTFDRFAHLISTAAVLAPCTGCRAPILACHAAGFRTYADPQSLTINAEIAAWVSNRLVFDVIGWGMPRKLYLEYRNLMRVTAGRNHPVVAQHSCHNPGVASSTPGMELAAHWAKPDPQPKARRLVNDNDGPIPF